MAHDLVTSLRDLVPQRRLSTQDALRVAEQQARLLLRRSGVAEPPISDHIIRDLPRIEVGEGDTGPSDAATQWSAGRWLVLLNQRHSRAKQRWSLAHELKHILDHPLEQILYPGQAGHDLAERSCNYFAGCLLVPRPILRRLWAAGVRDVPMLARRFGVTPAAMRLRLLQTGLIEPTSHHLGKEV